MKRKGMITAMLDVPTFLASHFYRNCKRQRRNKAKICGECPFREGIEDLERNITSNDAKE